MRAFLLCLGLVLPFFLSAREGIREIRFKILYEEGKFIVEEHIDQELDSIGYLWTLSASVRDLQVNGVRIDFTEEHGKLLIQTPVSGSLMIKYTSDFTEGMNTIPVWIPQKWKMDSDQGEFKLLLTLPDHYRVTESFPTNLEQKEGMYHSSLPALPSMIRFKVVSESEAGMGRMFWIDFGVAAVLLFIGFLIWKFRKLLI